MDETWTGARRHLRIPGWPEEWNRAPLPCLVFYTNSNGNNDSVGRQRAMHATCVCGAVRRPGPPDRYGITTMAVADDDDDVDDDRESPYRDL